MKIEISTAIDLLKKGAWLASEDEELGTYDFVAGVNHGAKLLAEFEKEIDVKRRLNQV